MAIEFTRKHQRHRELPLAALIDIVFILIFFFMLTTSFLQIESIELLLPSSGAQAASETATTTITLRGDDYVKFGNTAIAASDLRSSLSTFLADNPSQAFLLLVDAEVSTQRMVTVMDLITILGGEQVMVRALE